MTDLLLALAAIVAVAIFGIGVFCELEWEWEWEWEELRERNQLNAQRKLFEKTLYVTSRDRRESAREGKQ